LAAADDGAVELDEEMESIKGEAASEMIGLPMLAARVQPTRDTRRKRA
jgi:hypothetical protein